MQKLLNYQIERVKKNIDQKIIDFSLRCIKDVQLKTIGHDLDPEIFTETLYQYSNREDKIFLVAKLPSLENGQWIEKVVGCFFGESKFYPFSRIPIAVELYFSVLPEYRGYGISKAMLTNFETWAKLRGCKFLICGVNQFSSSSTNDAVDRLKKEGFLPFGQELYRELK